ncbi:SDR family oxidoreductase [Nocardia transvalensis]|uniref:SDR family oxidoreductase n=1 Tax=Nocardia transvalensis TaxID=37333 RepID=UPI00189514A0|nr:SDR family oxidoreductase [Nocardia transvalensis]MBF6331105.1 SDR family oxidoreductase [Nocardia transvalensis]
MRDIVVVTGTGGMGLSVARRLGSGRRLLLADYAPANLDRATDLLRSEGHDVHSHHVDVADQRSVHELADAAAALGTIQAVVHTAGLSPAMANPERILAVDLLGTVHMLDAFERHASPGRVLVAIASIAGHLAGFLTPEHERRLATSAATDLLKLSSEVLATVAEITPENAYALAKRGAQLRVQAASAPWAERGARVVSISPGLVSTPMGQLEIAPGADGTAADANQILAVATRLGTPDDIAAAVEWLASPAASFITGTDLRIDGGAVATIRWATDR